MHYLGIDIGAVTTDAAVIDDECKVVAETVRPTGPDMARAAASARDEVLRSAGAETVACTVATGYGRECASFANRAVSEIICHATGARHLFPNCNLVIDVGGQDTKVITLNAAGFPADFAMNDKCAAGTGRFLEVMAAALHVPLDEMGRRSLASKKVVRLASTCTVFGESEVISLIAAGEAVEDILAAIHRAVVERILAMAASLRGLPSFLLGRVVLSGGVARNEAVARLLSEKLGMDTRVPANPQTVGALGAALIAKKESGR
jgi:predicted CoA-substrate-specific enzyme activase